MLSVDTTRWEALLLVMDNRPFPELRRIMRDINDSRIWVQAEWVSSALMKYGDERVTAQA